jgi:hypothetical protein
MALPPLTEEGELRSVCIAHRCARFASGRSGDSIAQATGYLVRFVVFGSFVTSKLESVVPEYSAEAIDGTRTRKRHDKIGR